MPVIAFRLNGVPEDEAEDVRALLAERGIDYYETSAGNWGVSLAAIWLRDESRLPEAREAIDRYQTERRSRIRGEFRRLKSERGVGVFLDSLRDHPLRSIVYLAIVLTVLYFSTVPFINLTDWLQGPA